MPFVVTKYAATPHRLRYHLTQGDPVPGDVTLTMATLLADAANGPLKVRLQQLDAGTYLDGGAVFDAFFGDAVLSLDTPASSFIIPPGSGGVPGVVFDVDGFGKPLLLLGTSNRINTFLDLVFINSVVD